MRFKEFLKESKINFIDVEEDLSKVIPKWIDKKDKYGNKVWWIIQPINKPIQHKWEYKDKKGLMKSLNKQIREDNIKEVSVRIWKNPEDKFEGWFRVDKQ